MLEHSFLQELEILKQPAFAPEPCLIERRQRAHYLAESDAPAMRTYGHTVFGGHRNNREEFIHTTHPSAIDLTMRQSTSGKHLFEYDCVGSLLASRHPNPRRSQRLPQTYVA